MVQKPTDVEKRRDEALRQALKTPPKLHKDMKKGAKKKQDESSPTASGEKQT
jgi:hypothetical protein